MMEGTGLVDGLGALVATSPSLTTVAESGGRVMVWLLFLNVMVRSTGGRLQMGETV